MYLGIDPGVRKLGFALIQEDLSIVDAGILLQDKKNVSRTDQFDRMLAITNFFENMLQEHGKKIICAGVEQLFFTQSNQRNAEFVYGIRGTLIILLQKHDIAYQEYTPIELKKMITGNGKAQKKLVQNIIMKLYSLQVLPEYDDAADALGLAYLAMRRHKKTTNI